MINSSIIFVFKCIRAIEYARTITEKERERGREGGEYEMSYTLLQVPECDIHFQWFIIRYINVHINHVTNGRQYQRQRDVPKGYHGN